MSDFECPLCFSGNKCNKLEQQESNYAGYHCEHYDCDFSLSDDIIQMKKGSELREKILNLVTEHLIHQKYCAKNGLNEKWHFYYDVDDSKTNLEQNHNFKNLAIMYKSYPETFMDKANRTLVNLSYIYPNYGDEIVFFNDDLRSIFEYEKFNDNPAGMLDLLTELGYLSCHRAGIYIVSANGWKKRAVIKDRR